MALCLGSVDVPALSRKIPITLFMFHVLGQSQFTGLPSWHAHWTRQMHFVLPFLDPLCRSLCTTGEAGSLVSGFSLVPWNPVAGVCRPPSSPQLMTVHSAFACARDWEFHQRAHGLPSGKPVPTSRRRALAIALNPHTRVTSSGSPES